MGGGLSVDSRPGAGACFRLEVPLPPVPHRRTDRFAPGAGWRGLAAGVRVRALVVDDIEENREVLRRMLSSLGCEVVTASAGRRGLELARQGESDIVYLDIRMPDLDGLSVALAIRESFRGQGGKSKPPLLVALSASALAHEQERYRQAGFSDFLSKPVRWEALGRSLARLEGVRFEEPPPRERDPSMGTTPVEAVSRLPRAPARVRPAVSHDRTQTSHRRGQGPGPGGRGASLQPASAPRGG